MIMIMIMIIMIIMIIIIIIKSSITFALQPRTGEGALGAYTIMIKEYLFCCRKLGYLFYDRVRIYGYRFQQFFYIFRMVSFFGISAFTGMIFKKMSRIYGYTFRKFLRIYVGTFTI